MSLGGTPILLLKEGTKRERGRDAQGNNIMAAVAIAEAIRTALGPKGQDKMLVDSFGDVTITNDGATILKEIDVEHPAAKMIVEVAKTQDDEVGDGTTSAVVLAGELLKQAEMLIDQKIHPTVIVEGFRKATEKALNVLDSIAVEDSSDTMLKKVAMTAMQSKVVSEFRKVLADLGVLAIQRITDIIDGSTQADIDNVKVEKKQGGTIRDTMFIEGIVLDKEVVHPGMAKRVKNPKIALIQSAFEVEKTEFTAKIDIREVSQMQAFLDEEERMLRDMVEKVKKVGANVVLCQKGIDDVAQHFMAQEGIVAVRRIKESDMEKLARATGGKLISNLDDITKKDLGSAQLFDERKIADDKMVFVEGAKNPKAVSILLRGSTDLVLDEAERALHDALCVIRNVVEDGRVVAGGGAPEVHVAKQLHDYAEKLPGREQLAVIAFAEAMEIIPKTLAENAGLDPIDILADLKARHEKNEVSAGVDGIKGKVGDLAKANVWEPLVVKRQAIKSASEVSQMLLRIDDVIASKGMAAGGPPGGPPGGGDFED
ncbi:MAG: thermosome subunit alpha [Candidatus Hermodarchaeota archaeon]|nr:thermosome subunit alpha [Candidatus Hermodarchaeota archaeon]